jgi:carbon storage regulator
MLIMSRREGDTILIGDEIEIVIAHIGRTRVKVGIRAPRAMAVIPHEVKLIREQNRAAARPPGSPGATLSSLLARLRPPDHGES